MKMLRFALLSVLAATSLSACSYFETKESAEAERRHARAGYGAGQGTYESLNLRDVIYRATDGSVEIFPFDEAPVVDPAAMPVSAKVPMAAPNSTSTSTAAPQPFGKPLVATLESAGIEQSEEIEVREVSPVYSRRPH